MNYFHSQIISAILIFFMHQFEKQDVLMLCPSVSVCPGDQPRFRGYFGHNYEVCPGLFRLKYIS